MYKHSLRTKLFSSTIWRMTDWIFVTGLKSLLLSQAFLLTYEMCLSEFEHADFHLFSCQGWSQQEKLLCVCLAKPWRGWIDLWYGWASGTKNVNQPLQRRQMQEFGRKAKALLYSGNCRSWIGSFCFRETNIFYSAYVIMNIKCIGMFLENIKSVPGNSIMQCNLLAY